MGRIGRFGMTVLLLLVSAVTIGDPPGDYSADDMTADLFIQQVDAVKKRGDLAGAEAMCDVAIRSLPNATRLYAARAKIRYSRKNYPGAIDDLNVYVERTPSDTRMLLLRSISKSLLVPEDVAGACADLLQIKRQGTSLESLGAANTDIYCHGQQGWDGV